MENSKLKIGDFVKFLDDDGYIWGGSRTSFEKCYGVIRESNDRYANISIYKKKSGSRVSLSLLPGDENKDWAFLYKSLEKITPNWFQRLRASKI